MDTPKAEAPETEAEKAERLALEAAVAEAEASGHVIPHAVVRARLLEMVSEAEVRLARLARERQER